ncbi:hypothetical protein J7E95_39850 [Streptomyces sp. ISL-14]|nr:hypothetical protein [Streptomyces sp. ISL-14]
MILSPREIARVGLRDRYPEDDFPNRQIALRVRRALKRRDRQRTRPGIDAFFARSSVPEEADRS